jgi:hypothetical protein
VAALVVAAAIALYVILRLLLGAVAALEAGVANLEEMEDKIVVVQVLVGFDHARCQPEWILTVESCLRSTVLWTAAEGLPSSSVELTAQTKRVAAGKTMPSMSTGLMNSLVKKMVVTVVLIAAVTVVVM